MAVTGLRHSSRTQLEFESSGGSSVGTSRPEAHKFCENDYRVGSRGRDLVYDPGKHPSPMGPRLLVVFFHPQSDESFPGGAEFAELQLATLRPTLGWILEQKNASPSVAETSTP